MIVGVTQKDFRPILEERARFAEHRAQGFSLRPADTSQDDEATAQELDAREYFGMRILDDDVRQLFELIGQTLRDRVVAVDHRVDQRVGEVVGSLVANRSDSRTDSLAHRVEEAERALLEAEQVVLADDEADLRRANRVFVDHGRPSDHQLVVLVELGLRALRHVDRVLESDRMEIEGFADRTDRLFVSESLDVDPGDPVRSDQLL